MPIKLLVYFYKQNTNLVRIIEKSIFIFILLVHCHYYNLHMKYTGKSPKKK